MVTEKSTSMPSVDTPPGEADEQPVTEAVVDEKPTTEGDGGAEAQP